MGSEFAVGVVLALLGLALGMAQTRFGDNPRARHWCGIGMVAVLYAAVVVFVMATLGAFGMGGIQRNGLLIGVAVIVFFAFWPWIERHAGFSPPEPSPTPTASPAISYNGFLTPASQAPPGPGKFVIGTNSFVYSTAQKMVVAYYDTPFITVDFASDGQISIDATAVDEHGHYIAIVHGKEFKASPERAFNSILPDPHTLIVKDLAGKVVLSLAYKSTNEIELNGRFRATAHGKTSVIVFDDAGIHPPLGGPISHSLFQDNNFGPVFTVRILDDSLAI